ncbi:MAG: hypothetical protein P8L23_06305 [Flavobacteriales bacterium]|nr:hypothetical protein [Flavobacteriales bacterium]
MDLIKEIVITLSEVDKKEFEQFLTRKRPGKNRKDVEIFNHLYSFYNGSKKQKNNLSGNQNYHAIRKRITKALTNFLILKKSISEQKINKREGVVLMILYFIERKKYEVAWDLLDKEERNADKINNIDLNLKIQRLKLTVLPYYNQEQFPIIKKKMFGLQVKQAKIDEFQLYFIQIRNELKLKISSGNVDSPTETIKQAIQQYQNIKNDYNNPSIHLKVIEIIRSEYIINRKFKVFERVVQKYYNDIPDMVFNDLSHVNTIAQIEYIMAYTFLNTRKFKMSLIHLKKLSTLINQSEIVKVNYQAKHIAIESFIQVFDNRIQDAIDSIDKFLNKNKNTISVQEKLNLSLNLAAFLITQGSYSKAVKILNFMSEPDSYYQKEMGREWLVRKEMIMAIAQISLENIDNGLKIMNSIEGKHKEMLGIDQYSMVVPFIRAIKKYIDNPHEVNQDVLKQFEIQINLQKDKVFNDPRLIIFYAWLKSKYVKKDTYSVLKEEFKKMA